MDALEAGARGDLTVASEGQGSTFTVRLPQVS
jgi:signal transduction histidine kinase